MSPYKKKSWREKLADSKDFPRVEVITEKQSKKWGPGTIVIPAPMEVDEIMRMVPKGRLVTINEIRERLARKHGATIGCPICTGIFAAQKKLLEKEGHKIVKKGKKFRRRRIRKALVEGISG